MGNYILNMTSSSSSFVVTATCSRVTKGSKCTSGDSGSSSPAASSSSAASSFLGAKVDRDPNPPVVAGAAQALELLPALNPPNLKVLVGVLSFDSSVEGVEEVKDPKILLAVSVAAVVALLTACFTPSVVVAGATSVGPAVALAVVSFVSSIICS